ncbi:hypothetical protein I5G67_gp041 [Mycobacterium phage Aminay]|uniref:DUF7246 domain-containing protein n=1 Tax=Mycobacterium phage Aminay TaxID=2250291 RepID=A0A345KV27_9CAUD|nr:hypothetical protein I5G67_gp041 [Mycobacterium phage Aminay]AXH46879.1 hypothetical protein SEA_AMINAY_41 [Mycobacterium phage Aminay]
MITDDNGIEILPTDRVHVGAVGYGARHADFDRISHIVRMNRTRVVIIDHDGNERAIGGPALSVMRRDGLHGFEHNRIRRRQLDEAVRINGRQLARGTEVSIRGQRGRYRFLYGERTDEGKVVLHFMGGPAGRERLRSFYPERVKTVHRVERTRAVS